MSGETAAAADGISPRRRARALTLPHKARIRLSSSGEAAAPVGRFLDRCSHETNEKNKAIVAFNLDTVACLPTAFGNRLCPRCSLIAHEQKLTIGQDGGGKKIHAPADISDDQWAIRLKLIEEDRLQKEREAAAAQETSGEESDDDDDDSDEVKKPLTPNRPPPDEAQMRERDARVVSVLSLRSYDYSWSTLYNSVWAGLPPTTREQIWITQSMPPEALEESAHPLFEKLVENAHIEAAVYDQICKDIFRSFPSMNDRYFVSTLYRGLIVHATLRPDIGYGQGMNTLWGLVIMTISKPQQQLLVVEHILRNILPYYYTTQPTLGSIIDGKVLAYYFERRRPGDYRYFAERIGQDPRDLADFFTDFCFTHFSQLYARALPIAETVRLIDVIMMRGASALFEFAIRLFHYMYKKRKLDTCSHWIEITRILPAMFAKCNEQEADALYTKIARDTTLPLGNIVSEDLSMRRRLAAQNVFATIRETQRRKQ